MSDTEFTEFDAMFDDMAKRIMLHQRETMEAVVLLNESYRTIAQLKERIAELERKDA